MSSITFGEGAKAPFLNNYKLQFFWKRFPQTLTGGLRLKLGAPFYVYLYQIILFLWPVFLGGMFTVFTEYDILQDNISCYLYSGLIALSLICAHLSRLFLLRQSTRQRDHNVLADEDDIDFISCCDGETLQFIFPPKTHILNIFTHAIASGLMCGLTFIYLLPSAINKAYHDTGVIVVLCILGWLSLCIANYSLMVQPPPETATFRSLHDLQFTSFTRPFYVAIIATIGVLARYYSELDEANKVGYIIMSLLPLLWVIGLLPPFDALFSWFGEYLLVFALGGSYLASDIRLLVSLVLSGLVLLVACFINGYVVLITYSTILGFILSLDWFHLIDQLLHKIQNTNKTQKNNNWSVIDVGKHAVMLVGGGVIAAISSHFSKEATENMFDIFGYVFIFLFLMVKLLGDLQYVFIFAGLIRNPLYTKSASSLPELKRFQHKMKLIGQAYNILLRYILPLLIVTFLGLFLNTRHLKLDTFFITLGTVRALRQVWQNTWRSLIEVMILCIILWCKVDVHWWNTLGIGLQLLIIGFIYNRFFEFLKKASFMLTMYITSWTEQKQRHNATSTTLIISLIFFPVVLSILITSVALSAPLLPLFCFPIFFVGFPRPKRMWPSPSCQSSSASEGAVFYQQLVPKVCNNLKDFLAKGALTEMSDFILVRYQDRFIIIQIVEKGYKYCIVIARGLELQETSCHTIEATMVDDIFEEVFFKERTSAFGLNHFPLNTLTPLDCLVVETYSDAHNVLTGVIDQPENIQKQSSNFIKCLIWVLLTHANKEKQLNKENNFTQNVNEVNQSSEVPVPSENEVIDLNNGSKETLVEKRSSSNATTVQVANLNTLEKSWSDTEWSDEDDMEESNDKAESVFDTSVDQPFSGFGLPAQDTGRERNKTTTTTNAKQEKPESFKSGVFPTQTKVVPIRNNNQDNTSSELQPPHSWANILHSCKRAHTQIHSQFPEAWFNYLSKTLEVNEETLKDNHGLKNLYRDIVLSCFGVVNVLGLHGSVLDAGPAHIYRVYSGQLPWSPELDLMEQDSELKQLVLKAFRYAFKLTYDEAVLGAIDNEGELLETLNDYKHNWFIGIENEPTWNEAILKETPNLFSIGYDNDKGTFTSHLLTRQELILYTGRLNSEAIRGQWASLVMELLYLTNDDEERYSIQAHPVLLRNLTIQSADPPLGYAVYSSGPVHVPFGLL